MNWGGEGGCSLRTNIFIPPAQRFRSRSVKNEIRHNEKLKLNPFDCLEGFMRIRFVITYVVWDKFSIMYICMFSISHRLRCKVKKGLTIFLEFSNIFEVPLAIFNNPSGSCFENQHEKWWPLSGIRNEKHWYMSQLFGKNNYFL